MTKAWIPPAFRGIDYSPQVIPTTRENWDSDDSIDEEFERIRQREKEKRNEMSDFIKYKKREARSSSVCMTTPPRIPQDQRKPISKNNSPNSFVLKGRHIISDSVSSPFAKKYSNSPAPTFEPVRRIPIPPRVPDLSNTPVSSTSRFY